MSHGIPDLHPLREALKRVAVTLKQGDVPFALAGGYALWARGGPEPEHDVDFVVAEDDAPQAAELLAAEGLDVVQPPEDWLFKVFVDGAMVDLLFRTNGVPVQREVLTHVDQIEVESVQMPVLSATELMGQRLNAMEEHACDFGRTLPVARAVREQVDWEQVRADTAANDFAVAFLVLLERLGVIDAVDAAA
ncbi:MULTISPECIES: hypothetical protein [unclassified Nocardioides]|uniref:hypothetical protein n=1 Tax=unclassified Nocardioides TaxID=2615069 RepID=UPI002666D3F7|nr:hypothetical protein [Nocardioides sp. Arc9.136]WKN50050.1 hypothetical protein OSR43_07985 [Nocardioides sp. Arc9.136]